MTAIIWDIVASLLQTCKLIKQRNSLIKQEVCSKTPHTYPHLLEERGQGNFTGEQISQTQQLVAGIEPGPHDSETSKDSVCHCADWLLVINSHLS